MCLFYLSIIYFSHSAPFAHSPYLFLLLPLLDFNLFNTFNAVAITTRSIPRGWMWLYRALPLSHLTECLIMPQYQDNYNPLVLNDGTVTTVRAFVSEFLGFNYDDYWGNYGWMCLFLVCTLTLAFIASLKIIHNQR